MSGSKTAKDGYSNEYEIVKLIVDGDDKLLREIQQETGIICTFAVKVLGTAKTDVRGLHSAGTHNFSAKLFNRGKSYNHVSRTSPVKFCEQIQLGQITCVVLSIFTGHTPPSEHKELLKEGVDCGQKRVLMTDIKQCYVDIVLRDLQQNKDKIMRWAFLGNNDEIDSFIFSENDTTREVAKEHRCFTKEKVLKFYGEGAPMYITSRGSIGFGNSITMQRKGGSGSPTNIQLKFKPHLLYQEAR